MNWAPYVEALQRGETISFRPQGNSMRPRINSGNLVTVSPNVANLAVGDMVLCRVHGHHYVHLIKRISRARLSDHKIFLIGNNRGKTNGWAGRDTIFGKVTSVED